MLGTSWAQFVEVRAELAALLRMKTETRKEQERSKGFK